ncbi:MAG: CoA pyrophosphatase [Candidatus Latescibacteria bacterium]|nr:CoA pyrophosphatase [Candidatus Latescibacterota bacterium]
MQTTIESICRKLTLYSPVRADPEGRIEAAVALTLIQRDEDLEVLLIKRTDRDDDPWSGQIAFPGGRIETQDSNLQTTAIRETLEETAVDLTRGELLGELDDLSTSSLFLPPMMVRPFVFGLEQKQPVTPSEEVALHFWVPLAGLLEARVTEDIKVRGFSLTVQGYRFGSHLVWGMTERILTNFKGLI